MKYQIHLFLTMCAGLLVLCIGFISDIVLVGFIGAGVVVVAVSVRVVIDCLKLAK